MSIEKIPCWKVHLWYKSICDDIERQDTLKEYACPDFDLANIRDGILEQVSSYNEDELRDEAVKFTVAHRPLHIIRKQLIDMMVAKEMKKYIKYVSMYYGKIDRCAQARHNHFIECYQSTGEIEDAGHKHWREGFLNISSNCRETLDYWKEQLSNLKQKIDADEMVLIEKNKKRREKQKYARTYIIEDNVKNPDLPSIEPARQNAVRPPSREMYQKYAEEMRREKERKKMEELELLNQLIRQEKERKRMEEDEILDQLVSQQDEQFKKYANQPGMEWDYGTLRAKWKNVDFDTYFNVLEDQIKTFLKLPRLSSECDHYISEWQKQETNYFLMIPLSQNQQKRLISVLFSSLQRPEARFYLWTSFVNKMYLHYPDILSSYSLKEIESGDLDNEEEAVPKSSFMKMLHTLCDMYVQKAIQMKNVKWDPEVMYEIIGMMSKTTAQHALTKLAIRLSLAKEDEKRFYSEFMEQFQFYIIAHTNFYARVLETFDLPQACHGAVVAYEIYKMYMDEQDASSPIQFISKRKTLSIPIAKLRVGSNEQKRMSKIARKIKEICDLQIPF